MPVMPAPRRAAAALAGALLLLLSACSGDDGDPGGRSTSGSTDQAPSDTAESSTGSTATPDAAPPSLDPADRDRAEIKTVRRWAEAFATSVNDGDRTFAAAAGTMTTEGLQRMSRYTAGDWGRYLPGPLPVAPVGVREIDEDHHVVDACVMTSGWSWASEDDRTTWSTQVDAIALHLVRETGRWLVDGREGSDVECRGVELPRRLW
ncbi:hypothetical protein SAMN05421671_2526 [Pimelobacter simplex]|nr:hypothetical protein NSI01_38730 [Pimelobacter simplex]SFM58286.1 hypothetical protein SAMN05421671_2526 [Pimelobacter simplex]